MQGNSGLAKCKRVFQCVLLDLLRATIYRPIKDAKKHAKKAYGFSVRQAKFYRVEKGFCAQCGMKPYDNSQSYKLNKWGDYFNDESFVISHSRVGLLSMVNKGPDTNGSQFFITLVDDLSEKLDGRHVVFGLVTSGIELVKSFEDYAVEGGTRGRTKKPIRIVDSGQLD